MKRRKEVGILDIENPKCKWHKTVYLKDGKLMKTIHDGSFTQEEDEHSEYLCFEALEQGSTVKIVSQISNAPSFEYSTDGETWVNWQYETDKETEFYIFDTIELENIGDRLYVRGDNQDGLAEMGKVEILFTNFQFTGIIKCFGNVMSLITIEAEVTEVPDYGFAYLFSEPEGSQEHPLVSTPDMTSITYIGEFGCTYMFKDCSSLTKAANFTSLESMGAYACGAMYFGCDNVVLAENGQLTFDFVEVPFSTSHGESIRSVDGVVYWMTGQNS